MTASFTRSVVRRNWSVVRDVGPGMIYIDLIGRVN